MHSSKKMALVENNQPVSIRHCLIKNQCLMDPVRRIKDCFQKKKRGLWIKNPPKPEIETKGVPTAQPF